MDLPGCRFYLFGMGNRRKLLYADGRLRDAFTGEVLNEWEVAEEHVRPPEYCVSLRTTEGEGVRISEDEQGVWCEEATDRVCLTRSPVRLPRFEDQRQAPLLRVLHHDLLINLIHAGPVPNLLVYPRPWYRDAAMACMCLEKTGNLGLVEDWIRGLHKPFDRNNAGHAEPDNLGQVLYTGKDFVIIDFEGEPARELTERRLKRSPLRDVAGMVRSFHYAAYFALLKEASIRSEDMPILEPWTDLWYLYISGFFLRSYLDTVGRAPFIPLDKREWRIMLKAFLLEKAIYELGYELNNRPEWVVIPLKGIKNLLEGE